MVSNKWIGLYNHTTMSIVPGPVDPSLRSLNHTLYSEAMASFNDGTSHFNQRSDLFNNGIAPLWDVHTKNMPTDDALSLQQAVNTFQSLKYQNHEFDTFATKIGTTRAELQQSRKAFTATGIKNIFILVLVQNLSR